MLNYSSKAFFTLMASFGLEFVTSIWQRCILLEVMVPTAVEDTVLGVPLSSVAVLTMP